MDIFSWSVDYIKITLKMYIYVFCIHNVMLNHLAITYRDSDCTAVVAICTDSYILPETHFGGWVGSIILLWVAITHLTVVSSIALKNSREDSDYTAMITVMHWRFHAIVVNSLDGELGVLLSSSWSPLLALTCCWQYAISRMCVAIGGSCNLVAGGNKSAIAVCLPGENEKWRVWFPVWLL